jgi:hypothetical protein
MAVIFWESFQSAEVLIMQANAVQCHGGIRRPPAPRKVLRGFADSLDFVGFWMTEIEVS